MRRALPPPLHADALPEFGPIVVPANGAVVDEQRAFAVAVVQKSSTFSVIWGRVAEIACPIGAHARPVHAHEHEEIYIGEIMEGRSTCAYADAVVGEPGANQCGLVVHRVKRGSANQEPYMVHRVSFHCPFCVHCTPT